MEFRGKLTAPLQEKTSTDISRYCTIHRCQQDKSSNFSLGISTCFWYARTWPSQHKAFPRDYSYRRRSFTCVYFTVLFILVSSNHLVAEKLKQEGRHEIFEQETMEELEDDDGNVYNRKTYEDLKKQGLI
jgi:hypothetical protein